MFLERTKIDALLTELKLVEAQAESERKGIAESEVRIGHVLKAQDILQIVAEKIQTEAHQQIASVVTRCLEAVFEDEGYEFRIVFERKRGKTEARLVFLKEGHEESPRDASCGGIVDVASFALRLACLMLAKPAKRRFLAMDEPFKHLSSEYRPRMRELLDTLCREIGMQMLICTHADELKTGKVVELP